MSAKQTRGSDNMFTYAGEFITGWIWNPLTGMAESYGGWLSGMLRRSR